MDRQFTLSESIGYNPVPVLFCTEKTNLPKKKRKLQTSLQSIRHRVMSQFAPYFRLPPPMMAKWRDFRTFGPYFFFLFTGDVCTRGTRRIVNAHRGREFGRWKNRQSEFWLARVKWWVLRGCPDFGDFVLFFTNQTFLQAHSGFEVSWKNLWSFWRAAFLSTVYDELLSTRRNTFDAILNCCLTKYSATVLKCLVMHMVIAAIYEHTKIKTNSARFKFCQIKYFVCIFISSCTSKRGTSNVFPPSSW